MFAPIAPKGLSRTSPSAEVCPAKPRRHRNYTLVDTLQRLQKIQTSPRKKKGTSSAVTLSR
jgi:hypothetical protein